MKTAIKIFVAAWVINLFYWPTVGLYDYIFMPATAQADAEITMDYNGGWTVVVDRPDDRVSQWVTISKCEMLEGCYQRIKIALAENCACAPVFDADFDNDVDLEDFARMQRKFTGPF